MVLAWSELLALNLAKMRVKRMEKEKKKSKVSKKKGLRRNKNKDVGSSQLPLFTRLHSLT